MAGTDKSTGSFITMMIATFLNYLAMVMPMSTFSLQITGRWGMSNFLAGFVSGAAFFITMILRKRSGDLADRLGGKHCFVRGSAWYAAGGLVSLLSLVEALPLPVRLSFLIAGRLVIGVGESMTNIGVVHWSIGLLGDDRSGRAMVSIGMAMYAAVAVGGQAGFLIYSHLGFGWLMLAGLLAPLAAFLISRPCPAAPHHAPAQKAAPFLDVMESIWRLGIPAMLHAVGFAVLGAFISKTFLDRGWEYAGLGLTCYGIGYIVQRLVVGHLPDKLGGYPVASFSSAVAMAGGYCLWLAPGPVTALAGSFLVGAGCSMIFPSLAREIVRDVPLAKRGASLSCFSIYQDISYGFAGPAAGFFVDRYGDGVAYGFTAIAATLGFLLIFNQYRANRKKSRMPK